MEQELCATLLEHALGGRDVDAQDGQVVLPVGGVHGGGVESSAIGRLHAHRTAFAHGRVVDLYECGRCGLLVRGDLDDDFTAIYEDDPYDDVVLEHFLERDIRLFAAKEDPYAALLPRGARVVEVGSYAGGFLHVAAGWGWKATGIDIGEDVARFANARGYETLRCTLQDCAFAAASLDGVFIWNCFDQLPDPAGTLAEALRILKPGGLLVVRVPNALFYRLCQPLLRFAGRASDDGLAEHTITKVMGYNNLLGFPYQYGYAPPNLRLLVERHGFVPERFVTSHLMMLSEAEAPAWALDDQHATTALLADLAGAVKAIHADVLVGPWFECIARKA